MPNGDLHLIDEYNKLSPEIQPVHWDALQISSSGLGIDVVTSSSVDIHHPMHVLDKRKINDDSFKSNNNPVARTNIYHRIDRVNIPIWCMDCKNNLVVLGCIDGCMEFWECASGQLKVRRKFLLLNLQEITVHPVK